MIVRQITNLWRRNGKSTRRLLAMSAVGVGGASCYTVFNQTRYYGEEAPVLPTQYDIAAIERYFLAKPWETVSRSFEIISTLFPYLTRLLLWEYIIRRKIQTHDGLQSKYAKELREILTNLGPCFIKLGQAISIRPDLLPAPFLVELQQLCDAVPSFPTKEAIKVIEEELGKEVGEVFHGIKEGEEPIAAASLGQVYKVELVHTGEIVAVKVQRPDMHYWVLRDLLIIRYIARAWQRLKTTFTYQRPFDVALVDTWGKATLQELDYLNEAANQTRCKVELEPRMRGKVYIPKVYSEYTTRKVLVTEWIQGPQLAKSSNEVIRQLTPVGVECFLVQLLETGFFHADPHPGNLLVTQDGKLAIIDFGLMAEVPKQDTEVMTKTIVHLMQGDVPGLVEDAVDLGFLPQEVDRSVLTPVLQSVFDAAQLAVTDQARERLQYSAIQSRRKQFWAVSFDLNKVFYLHPFLVPDYFALVTRAMIVLEGIALTGDPHFDLFRTAYPYSLKRAVTLFGYSGVLQIAKEASVKLLELGVREFDGVKEDLLAEIG